ncbi:hypothetical protein [Aquibacillus rhizosphaerae]|uniref:Fur-regulated basic protein FbpA n=1 Tax=Aquibacillus rhizosphaerae TaxID=3051431 RepID=A0ABT7L8Z1_9BACI|nr:hypothetical protein [Aquibacillus sp. LR5S19]MDL4841041.1 hypothetical protein [Aquibacillus sp. LR5S19]
MTFLREAVQKQKELLIKALENDGLILPNDPNIHNKTISEIINEYDEFLITTEKNTHNSLKFTKTIQVTQKKKPKLH